MKNQRKWCMVGAMLTGLLPGIIAEGQQKKPMETQTAKPKNLASDIKADALWDGRGLVGFKGLDNPPMIPAAQAVELGDEEYILGLTVGGISRAYPTRYVWWHHVVNDKVGETNFAVTYCSVCNTGIAYNLKSPVKTGGKPVSLDFLRTL